MLSVLFKATSESISNQIFQTCFIKTFDVSCQIFNIIRLRITALSFYWMKVDRIIETC